MMQIHWVKEEWNFDECATVVSEVEPIAVVRVMGMGSHGHMTLGTGRGHRKRLGRI
jgi:hypothetical protein